MPALWIRGGLFLFFWWNSEAVLSGKGRLACKVIQKLLHHSRQGSVFPADQRNPAGEVTGIQRLHENVRPDAPGDRGRHHRDAAACLRPCKAGPGIVVDAQIIRAVRGKQAVWHAFPPAVHNQGTGAQFLKGNSIRPGTGKEAAFTHSHHDFPGQIKAVIGFLGKRAAHNGSLDDSGIQLVQELICITLVDAEFHPGMLLAVLAVAVVGGGAAFYFKVIRPKQQEAAGPEEDYGGEPEDYEDMEDDGPPWDEDDPDENSEEDEE